MKNKISNTNGEIREEKEKTTPYEIEKKYSLLTAISMIVGICIGSGIFFKSDNVLAATNGNVFLGILVFLIGATGIIFGSISIGVLSEKTVKNKKGGIIGYAEEFAGKKFACMIGWFQAFIYYPGLVSIVSWVGSIYFCQIFGITISLESEILISLIFVISFYLLNILSAKAGGYFQDSATILKLIPLIVIAFFGIFLSNNSGQNEIFSVENFSENGGLAGNLNWMAAIGPIAFAYDGWVISTAIGGEIKNSKKNISNLTIALIVAPIFIAIIYILYFAGASLFLSPTEIISQGDAHLGTIAENLFSSLGLSPQIGRNIILTFVLISVLGTLNGVILGYIRIPHSLSMSENRKTNLIPYSEKYRIINDKFGINLNSAYLSFTLSVLWLIAHYITTKFNLLPNSDVSEVAITVSYLLYIILYYQVFKLWKTKKIKSFFKGVIAPTLATLGSLIVLFGGMQNRWFILYVCICSIILISSLIFIKKKKV